ncbi:MAG: peptidylprolyl isomerase [Planctomycetota bacterium]|jgi:peptidyl-prolyl cis-trans isomerase B (cyclophilin B)
MRLVYRILAIALLAPALACGKDDLGEAAEPAGSEAVRHIVEGPHAMATFDLGELGTIRVELLHEIAPKSVAYFTKLANEGHYDGTYFHRVIPDFMIQGGDNNTLNKDPRDDGDGAAPSQVVDEFTDYPHTRGTLALANTGYKDSNGSQFFFVHRDSPHLDGSYNVLGRIVEGIEVVDKVTELEIDLYGRYGPKNRPYPVNATLVRVRVESVNEQAAAAAEAEAEADPPASAQAI